MRLVRRNCYLADGVGPLVPQAVPIEWQEGARVELPWQLRRSNNTPKDLSGVVAILLSFFYKDNDTAAFLTLEATVTDAVNGLFEFVVLPSHIALLKRGYYIAQVTIDENGAGYDPIVLRSRVQVRPYDSTSGALALLPVYFGEAAIPGSIDEAFVLSLAGTGTQPTRNRVIDFNQGAGEYGWYAYPASFGGAAEDFFDTDTDLEAGVQLAATVNVTGPDAIVRSYSVWRTDVAGLGAWQMEAR